MGLGSVVSAETLEFGLQGLTTEQIEDITLKTKLKKIGTLLCTFMAELKSCTMSQAGFTLAKLYFLK